jgi:hypothetical protein
MTHAVITDDITIETFTNSDRREFTKVTTRDGTLRSTERTLEVRDGGGHATVRDWAELSRAGRLI